MLDLAKKLRDIEEFLNQVEPYTLTSDLKIPFDRGDAAGRIRVALTLASDAIRIARLAAIEASSMPQESVA